MDFRRGFKSEANSFSREFRAELSLDAHDPLCPWDLAKHLEIPVFSISSLKTEIPNAVKYFYSGEGRRLLSAVTLFRGMKRVIIHNDAHDLKRQAANIAHELAHAILLHPPKPPFDENGERQYSRELEDEANWFGPALLVSEEAALWIAKSGTSISSASNIYKASEEVIRMRLNVCGAFRRIIGRRTA